LFGNVASAILLLENGADVNSKNQSNSTPLHLAAYYTFPDLIFLLCEHLADVSCVNNKLETPLLATTKSSRHRDVRDRLGSHATCISMLLRYGSLPNVKSLQNETALQNVLRYCTNLTCAHLLMSAGASAKLDCCDTCKNYKTQRMWTFWEKTRNNYPMRLEVLCLIKTRKTLGSNFSRKLKQLQLSRQIEQLLLFQKLPKLF